MQHLMCREGLWCVCVCSFASYMDKVSVVVTALHAFWSFLHCISFCITITGISLQDALELMERHYLHVDYKQGDTRALAFRQASCVLKALPRCMEL